MPTHRLDGSGREAETHLSEDRLALVQRYMIDAEEAEARAQRTAEERARRRAERARSDFAPRESAAERPVARAAAVHLEAEQPPEVAKPDRGRGLATKEAAPARKATVKAQRRTAKEAARQVAAMEKREDRERKALAKAAAKRRNREAKGLAKFARH